MINLSIERKKNRLGLTVYSDTYFHPGDIVVDLDFGDFTEKRNFRTVELDNIHVDHPYIRYVNHSCSPNTKVDKINRKLIAIKFISPGEEIFFDYNDSETIIDSPFICNCGSENCRREIK